MLTMQRIDLGTKDAAKFLRAVAKTGDWTSRASTENEWKLCFYRTIKGEIGEPDADIEVQSDIDVHTPNPSECGMKKSFSDCEPVMVVSPRYLYLDKWDTAAIAGMILDSPDFRLELHVSSGSTNSSRLGLSFYYLEFQTRRKDRYPYAVRIGGETIAKDGQCICCGAVNIR